MRQGMYAGWVGSYNPSTRIYNVNVDGLGDKPARRLHSGIDRPYPNDTRVLCVQAHDMAWVILGEVEMPEPPVGSDRPKTVDDSAADLVTNLGLVNTGVAILDTPQYRNPLAEINFAGDAAIENRVADPRSRSRIKIYSFGSVLVFASNFCFQLFNPKNNKILTSARSLVTRAVGHIKSIIFNPITNKTTIHEKLQSSPLEKNATGQPAPKTDRETFEGDVPAPNKQAKYGRELLKKPKVVRGRRDVYGDHRVEERDNKTHSYRERQDSVVYNADGTEKSRKTELYKEEGRIVSGSGAVSYGSRVIYRDWLVIEINNETNSVRIEDLKRSQKIEMSATGVFIKGNNVSIDGDVIKLTASSAIHLDTPALLGTNLVTALFETPKGTPMLSLDSAGGGYFDLSPYKGIVIDGYTKLVSLYQSPRGFSIGKFISGFRSKIGLLKKLLGSVRSAAQSLLGDRASLLKETAGNISPDSLSGLASGITPPDLSGITPPDLSGVTPPNLSGVTPPNINLPSP